MPYSGLRKAPFFVARLNLRTDAEQGSGGPEKFRLMEGNRWSRVESDWGQTMFLVFSLKKTPHELPSQFTVRRGAGHRRGGRR